MNLDRDFIQSIVMLFLTAGLTGTLIPILLNKREEVRTKNQKTFEADIDRQAKIIEAQSKFLDSVTESLWNWRYLTIKVAYYGSNAKQVKYATVAKEYDEKIWDTLNNLRNLITVSRRLVSERAYKQLVTFYDQSVELDNQISTLIEIGRVSATCNEEFARLNEKIRWQITEEIDVLINAIAVELHLKNDDKGQ